MIKTRTNFRRLALCLSLIAPSIPLLAQDANEKSQEPTPVHSVNGDTAGKSGKTIVGYGGLDYYNFDNGGRVGKFAVSGGYNWWFNKFKFKKDYIADGFWVSVSYCINTK